ncbi:MAG: site-specific DNA-methyltransferase [Dehalococcoidia bacterium]|jgi:site-specific DNA-methyltransferase (adenine-specific)
MSKSNGNGSKTSAFGSPGRFGHDSSKFYAGRLYDGVVKDSKVEYIENPLPPEITDRFLCKSSINMDELPDTCIHLVVTSPPYNVGKEYDENLTLSEYRSFLRQVFTQVYRVLVPGGRLCLNLANLGRTPYIPLHAYITQDLIECGYLMRGEIIWDKGGSASRSTAWGSWLSPTNPTLRDTHEYILIFSKQGFYRPLLGRKPTITREEFLKFTKSIWHLAAEPAIKTGHPAPFPVELPYRCIQLYTAEEDVVLDPFMGAGATAMAARQSKRRFIGYDIEQKYCDIAKRRLANSDKEHKNLPLSFEISK